MKKILLALILIFTFSLSSTLAATGDVDGFKGYKWGTDFQTIDKDKDLAWFKSVGEIGYHIGVKDIVFDKNENVKIAFEYQFYDNKLVGGMIFFYDYQINTDFSEAVESLKHRHGAHDRYNDGFYFYYLPTTIISYAASPKADSRAIMFFSRKYMREAIEREKQAEAQKKQNTYNRIFN